MDDQSIGADALAVDPDGRVWALGSHVDGPTMSWIAAYDADGTSVGSHTLDFAGTSLAFDDRGNMVVGGMEFSGSRRLDFAVRACDSSLRERWRYAFDGGAGRDERVHDVAIGPRGNVYATGSIERASGQTNIWTMKLDPQGVERWGLEHENPCPSLGDAGGAVVVESPGDIVVAGRTMVCDQGLDDFLRRYAEIGALGDETP